MLKKIKKWITSTLICLLAMTSVAVFPAHAEEDPFAADNAEIKTNIAKVIASLRDNKKDNSADTLQAILDVLETKENETLSSVEDAENIIIGVLESEDVLNAKKWTTMSQDKLMLQVDWLNQMNEAVGAYGFSRNKWSYVNYFDETGETSGDVTKEEDTGDEAQEKSEKASRMIQRLRWAKKDKYSTINLVSILEKYESTFGSIMGILQSISAALLVAFGCSNLLKLSSDRTISTDAITREFLKIIFGLWFLFNYQYFAIMVMRVGAFITETFLDASQMEAATAESTTYILRHGILKSLEQMMINGKADTYLSGLSNAATGVYGSITSEGTGILEDIGTTLCKLFGGAGGLIGGNSLVSLSINWVVFSVMLELGIRYIFTPIAIADLYSEGFRSNGARWLKKMASCALTGALLYLVLYGSNVIKLQMTGFHPIQLTAVNLTMCGSFIKMRQIADEIVGVR